IVDVGLDMAAVIGRAGVRHSGHAQDLLGARRVKLVAAKIAALPWHLVMRPKQRPLLEHEHGLALPHQTTRDRRATSAAAYNNNVEAVPHPGSFPARGRASSAVVWIGAERPFQCSAPIE